MTDLETDFATYQKFADQLRADLIASHGRAKADRLFKPMDREKFRTFREAAVTDELKRLWWKKITSYASGATKAA